MPAVPVQSFKLLLANCEQDGRSGTVAIRVATVEEPDRIRSEGSATVPVGDCPRWKDVKLVPPLVEVEGQPLALQVAVDVEPGAELRVGATKGYRYTGGRLWINGALAWPDQNLEFMAYGAPEPTRSKMLAIWMLMTSDWRWPVLAIELAVALTLIMFIPGILVARTCVWSPKPSRFLRRN